MKIRKIDSLIPDKSVKDQAWTTHGTETDVDSLFDHLNNSKLTSKYLNIIKLTSGVLRHYF